jgi:hypothetical protein
MEGFGPMAEVTVKLQPLKPAGPGLNFLFDLI